MENKKITTENIEIEEINKQLGRIRPQPIPLIMEYVQYLKENGDIGGSDKDKLNNRENSKYDLYLLWNACNVKNSC